MWFIETKGGNIFINKKLVNDYEVNWGNLIGYVPQNYYLIDGSIKENIAFGQTEDKIDLGKVNKSLNVSQLNNLIENLEFGIDTKIGEEE